MYRIVIVIQKYSIILQLKVIYFEDFCVLYSLINKNNTCSLRCWYSNYNWMAFKMWVLAYWHKIFFYDLLWLTYDNGVDRSKNFGKSPRTWWKTATNRGFESNAVIVISKYQLEIIQCAYTFWPFLKVPASTKNCVHTQFETIIVKSRKLLDHSEAKYISPKITLLSFIDISKC